MYRGTTPSFNFIFPNKVPVNQFSDVFVTFSQEGCTVFEFDKHSLEISEEDNSVKVTLTQEHTLKLNDRYTVRIQLRVKTWDGTALASSIFSREVRQILKDGEI